MEFSTHLDDEFPAGYKVDKDGKITVTLEWIYDFANNVVALEREECAKLCEKSDRHRGDYFAEKIRGRGRGVWWTI